MAEAFAELQTRDGGGDLPHADWLALLIDRELADRNTRRFRTRLRADLPKEGRLPDLRRWRFCRGSRRRSDHSAGGARPSNNLRRDQKMLARLCPPDSP
jgi:hypothetical protein